MTLLYSALLAAALVLIQFLIGGTQFAYCFPSYIILGLAGAASLFSIRQPGFKTSAVCLLSAALFAAYTLARAWFSPNPYLARADAYLAAACLVVYLLTALHVTQSRHRLWIVGALLAVAAVHVAIGAFQFKNGDNWYLSRFGFYTFDKPTFRSGGLMISGNHMAGFLEALAVFALSLTLWSRCRAATKMLTGYLALLCYAGVVMSGSRGGYLSSAFSLLVFTALTLWVIRIVNRQRFLAATLGAAAVLALVLGFTATAMTRSAVIRDRLDRLANATQDVRRYNWAAALDQFQLSPWVGTGSGTHLYYGRLFRQPQIQSDPEHAHGDYLELLAEYGVLGAAVALLFLAAHVGAGMRAAREVAYRRLCNTFGPARSDTLALTLGALGAAAALLSHSVVDFNMHIPGNALLFAFVFGILASPALDKEPAPGGLSLAFRGGLGIAGAALAVLAAIKYPAERWANLSRLALGSNHFAESAELARKAIEADPANPNPYFYLGEASRVCANRMPNFALGEPYYEEAVQAFRKGLERFPQDENLWVRLAQALDGLTWYEEAGEAYRQAIALDPNLGILYTFYGAHFRLLGEEDAARACETAARALGSRDFHQIGAGERPAIPFFYRKDEPEGAPKQR